MTDVKPKKKTFSYIKCVEVLISLAVPVSITIYTVLQDKRQTDIARENRQHDADQANKTRLNDLYIASEQLQDAVLNNYVDFLADLLEKIGINFENDPTVRLIAHFKTLAVLKQLNLKRKAEVIRSLHVANLINIDHVNKTKPVIELSFALLHDLDLTTDFQSFQTDFADVYLSQIDLANASFRAMSIVGTQFDKALMNGADLSLSFSFDPNFFCRNGYTSFQHTWLLNARFNSAAYYFTDFTGAKMRKSQLQSFYCAGCRFLNVDLSGADLSYSNHPLGICQIEGTNETRQRSSIFKTITFNDGLLHNSSFSTSIFSGVHMERIDASGITFKESHFDKFDCFNCSFNHSFMVRSNFTESNMMGSTMINIRVHGGIFQTTVLRNINFSSGQFHDTVFQQVNFTDSIFMDTSFNGCIFDESFITDKQLAEARHLVNVTFSNWTIIK